MYQTCQNNTIIATIYNGDDNKMKQMVSGWKREAILQCKTSVGVGIRRRYGDEVGEIR